MNDNFDTYAVKVAKQLAPTATAEMFNGTLFVEGCTASEASKMQTMFGKLGLGVIVTPGNTYAFDFV